MKTTQKLETAQEPCQAKPARPRWMRVYVTEGGKETANVRVPFFLLKMGLSFARAAGGGDCEAELEKLRDIDLDALVESVRSGELTLPCTLVDVVEPEKNEHVTVTLM